MMKIPQTKVFLTVFVAILGMVTAVADTSTNTVDLTTNVEAVSEYAKFHFFVKDKKDRDFLELYDRMAFLETIRKIAAVEAGFAFADIADDGWVNLPREQDVTRIVEKICLATDLLDEIQELQCPAKDIGTSRRHLGEDEVSEEESLEELLASLDEHHYQQERELTSPHQEWCNYLLKNLIQFHEDFCFGGGRRRERNLRTSGRELGDKEKVDEICKGRYYTMWDRSIDACKKYASGKYVCDKTEVELGCSGMVYKAATHPKVKGH